MLFLRSIKRIFVVTACTLWLPTLGFALGPHEILVLANGGEPDSIEVAKAYAHMRQIPDVNVVVLRMPAWKPKEQPVMRPEDFTRLIWTPTVQAAKARGINKHILAWVYSTHFPIRISCQPPVSLQGLTFVRNRMPKSKAVSDGLYESLLFAGPDGPGGNAFGPQTFDTSYDFLKGEMPLPNMALGYTGKRGNTKDEVMACLERGLESDATQPHGTVYFVTNDNVRSTCRQWQFPLAVRGLRRMGVKAEILADIPEVKRDVFGVMMGAANVNPSRVGRFIPGCMAENLTSCAAMFDHANQTKISRWIAAGAAASAGTVFEPRSIWSKFPNARFYNHYVAGCTLIESFYQSVRCPLQLMMIGDPLAAPWAPKETLEIEGLSNGELISQLRQIDLRLNIAPGSVYNRFVYLVDGLVQGEGESFMLDPAGLAIGRHELRVVAYRTGFLRSQIFDVKTFRTD